MTSPARTPGHVLIAGIPWPVYKLVALTVGILVFVVVGVVTTTIGTAVVAGAAAASVVWLGLSLFHPSEP